jgi:hypothetical protein
VGNFEQRPVAVGIESVRAEYYWEALYLAGRTCSVLRLDAVAFSEGAELLRNVLIRARVARLIAKELDNPQGIPVTASATSGLLGTLASDRPN